MTSDIMLRTTQIARGKPAAATSWATFSDEQQGIFCINHSTTFVLFNDTLNTIYLRLYVIKHMIKGHSDSERGNPLSPHGLLFPISSNGSFIDRIIHTTAFVTPVVEHWLERKIAQ